MAGRVRLIQARQWKYEYTADHRSPSLAPHEVHVGMDILRDRRPGAAFPLLFMISRADNGNIAR